MERKFKTGDKVRLVSDSSENQPMTVKGYALELAEKNPTSSPFMGDWRKTLEDMVVCDWRDRTDRPQEKEYHEEELVKC